MNYRELAERIAAMTPEQLKQDVLVYDGERTRSVECWNEMRNICDATDEPDNIVLIV